MLTQVALNLFLGLIPRVPETGGASQITTFSTMHAMSFFEYKPNHNRNYEIVKRNIPIINFYTFLGTRKTQATHEYDEATRSQKTLR